MQILREYVNTMQIMCIYYAQCKCNANMQILCKYADALQICK